MIQGDLNTKFLKIHSESFEAFKEKAYEKKVMKQFTK